MTDPPLIGPVEPPSLQVMSFNIRRRLPHVMPGNPDRWEKRRSAVALLLAREQPTLLGVQEALPDQAGFVRHALGRRYRSIGFGRNADNRGEGCPVFYDRDRLELLDWSQTALSETPDVAGSTSWGNRVPRILVDATFRDRETDRELRFLNTHFDHRSRQARLRSAELVRARVALTKLPTIVTGDFNTSVGSLPFDAITAGRTLVDTWDVASDRLSEPWGTFPDYRAPRVDHKRIDWILVSPRVQVRSVGVNVTRFGGVWPSDHAPVQAVIGIRASPR